MLFFKKNIGKIVWIQIRPDISRQYLKVKRDFIDFSYYQGTDVTKIWYIVRSSSDKACIFPRGWEGGGGGGGTGLNKLKMPSNN